MINMERKEQVLNDISEATKPISAKSLATKYGISRQIIVGDVALLRAAGYNIMATPRGYILDDEGGLRKKIAVKHDREAIEEELNIIVDQGGRIEDVIVEHPVYGEIKGNLHISSRYDVKKFMEKLNSSHAAPLSELTDGIHLHTIVYEDQDMIERIERELERAGYLYR
ncbi:MAG TPA: transcription repressor NadR [Erysipelotrichaceae bacterium]|nr:transcription repressor NadR [Erysipelotrichaceae bacterium]